MKKLLLGKTFLINSLNRILAIYAGILSCGRRNGVSLLRAGTNPSPTDSFSLNIEHISCAHTLWIHSFAHIGRTVLFAAKRARAQFVDNDINAGCDCLWMATYKVGIREYGQDSQKSFYSIISITQNKN